MLRAAFRRGVAAVLPAEVLPPHLPPLPKGRLLVLGAGKAAAAMAQVVEQHYGRPLEGLVVTRYGHAPPLMHLELLEAGHPLPDANGLAASAKMLELARGLGPDDLLLCLLSGGGSALLTAPEGVTLAQKTDVTRALLRSGADIHEINTVRKHLSNIKGGRLAAAAAPARVVSLVISDVPGDDPSSIASGPTAPDPGTFVEALAVLGRYRLDFPVVRRHLEAGAAGDLPETPKPGDPLFERVDNRVVASAQGMLEAVAAFFAERGIHPVILSASLTGEAREAAKFHAALARQIAQHGQPARRPCVLISGGETTVTVRGQGRGGRNGEFLLALALELTERNPGGMGGLPDVYALAADSDGIDGSEDNAGAIIGPDALSAALSKVSRREAREYLEKNDSYGFFTATGGLLVTGPTYTNVNDLRIILLA